MSLKKLTKSAAREAVKWYFEPVGRAGSPAKEATGPVTVAMNEEFESRAATQHLSAAENRALMLLVVKLMYAAGDIAPDPETGLRVIELTRSVIFEDGAELAPLALFYTLSGDGSTAYIVDVKPLHSDEVVVAADDLMSTIASAVETSLKQGKIE